jgi:hypothetical protein
MSENAEWPKNRRGVAQYLGISGSLVRHYQYEVDDNHPLKFPRGRLISRVMVWDKATLDAWKKKYDRHMEKYPTARSPRRDRITPRTFMRNHYAGKVARGETRVMYNDKEVVSVDRPAVAADYEGRMPSTYVLYFADGTEAEVWNNVWLKVEDPAQ